MALSPPDSGQQCLCTPGTWGQWRRQRAELHRAPLFQEHSWRLRIAHWSQQAHLLRGQSLLRWTRCQRCPGSLLLHPGHTRRSRQGKCEQPHQQTQSTRR